VEAANISPEEKNLIDAAVSWLQAKLPASWSAATSSQTISAPNQAQPAQVDAIINLGTPQGGSSTLIVEARRSLTPRDADELVSGGLSRRLRRLNPNNPILVIAPWLSARTREMLTADDINFLDLTGNARIALSYPPLFINSEGATRNPAPTPRGAARLRGPRAARLFRLLADVAPPYGVTQIASVTGLAPGYVSRLLETLDQEALIERSRRGQVVATDVSDLLRRWADTYDVFRSNDSSSFVAPQGPSDVVERVAASATSPSVAVTGSFAAVRLAPVAAPALFVAYCKDVEAFADEFQLLPADRGSNVILLRPFDEVVWERTISSGGLTYTAASQTAVDCLTGNGRMPAEGEALLTWMQENEVLWRIPSLDQLLRQKGTS